MYTKLAAAHAAVALGGFGQHRWRPGASNGQRKLRIQSLRVRESKRCVRSGLAGKAAGHRSLLPRSADAWVRVLDELAPACRIKPAPHQAHGRIVAALSLDSPIAPPATTPGRMHLSAASVAWRLLAAFWPRAGKMGAASVRASFAVAVLAAQPLAGAADPAQSIIVGVAQLPPHVMEGDGGVEGFDIDIWNEVASLIEVESTFQLMNFADLLGAIKSGEVDVGVAGISITHAREIEMDFSIAYIDAGLRILTSVERESAIMRVIRSVSTDEVVVPLGYLLGFVILCSHILYLAERGSRAIDSRYFPGIFEAAWCILATITTVGYGDVTPRRWLGRFVSLLVMVIGIALFGVAVAELSSGLMVEYLKVRFTEPEDLAGHAVATVAGTTSVDIAHQHRAKVHEVDRIEEAYRLLQAGSVDAVIFDSSPLMHFAREDGNHSVTVTGPMIQSQEYAFAFQQGSALREPVNRAILAIRESGRYEIIYSQWFGITE